MTMSEALEMDDEKTHFVIDESAMRTNADFWYALPPGYIDVPFEGIFTQPESEEKLAGALRPLMASMSPAGRRTFLDALQEAENLTSQLSRQGVQTCAFGVHEGDKGECLHSALTIARVETPWTPAKLTVMHAATSRESATPLSITQLGCGPAAFAESEVQLPQGAADNGQADRLYQATAYLATPDKRGVIVVTLSTTATHAADGYRSIVRSVAETVSFDNPLPEEARTHIPEPKNVAEARLVFG
jgi:hypothetical protein